MRLVCLATAILAGCSSSPTVMSDPKALCTQMLTKQLVCGGGFDSCQLFPDGGSVCDDMAGAVLTPDAGDVARCTAGAPYWNVAYFNALFACYLDGKTTMCDGDYRACQDAAVMKVGRRASDVAFGNACQASTCSFNGDTCFASIFYSDSVVQQASQCFSQACTGLNDCLAAAHLN